MWRFSMLIEEENSGDISVLKLEYKNKTVSVADSVLTVDSYR